jgi:hypothetical protein
MHLKLHQGAFGPVQYSHKATHLDKQRQQNRVIWRIALKAAKKGDQLAHLYRTAAFFAALNGIAHAIIDITEIGDKH